MTWQSHLPRMIYRRAALGILCCMAVVASPRAHSQAGNAGLAFLKLGVSGRGVAMGDAMSATVNGAAATYYNPAGLLALSPQSEILFMHKEWLQDTRTEFLGAVANLDSNNALGFSLNTTTVSEIEIRTRPGPSEGSFDARNLSLGISYARGLAPGMRVALSAKLLYEKILVDEATGFAVDAGIQIDDVFPSLSVGASMSNIGSMSTLLNTSSTLPALARAGAAYGFELPSIRSRVCIAGDLLYVIPESAAFFNLGGEMTFREIASLRGGYQFGTTGRGLTLGAGFRYGIAGFDYAFSRLTTDLGNGHTFSLSVTL